MGLKELKRYYETLSSNQIKRNLDQKIAEIRFGGFKDIETISKQYFVLCNLALNKKDFGIDEIDKYMLKYAQEISYLVEKIEREEKKTK